MGKVIGIDLGTTNSCVAIMSGGDPVVIANAEGSRTTPSVVGITDKNERLVGQIAKRQAITNPENTIFSVKRLMGRKFKSKEVQEAMKRLPYKVVEADNGDAHVELRGKRYSPPEVSAMILQKMRQTAEDYLGEKVTEAVVTVPAYFDDAQRQATRDAGRLAGLDVVRIVNEPTAAALAYGFGQRKDETVCVFDFGGGTFDVSVLAIKDEIFQVLATDGDFFLGGDDIDRAIAEFLAAELNRQQRLDPRPHHELMTRLALAGEEIKIHLSSSPSAEGVIDGLYLDGREYKLSFRLTRTQLEEMVRGFVDRAMELTRNVLAAAHLEPRKITEVVCVGGTTRVPLVRQRLTELFGKEPALRINPDEVVAQGAAIQAGSLGGSLYKGVGMSTRVPLVR
ncbi:MAG TPA: molecular chaperone DnaK, partial [Nitrospira sp.]|nr:molecular chaperone DnaK [Nitrospira sp.]